MEGATMLKIGRVEFFCESHIGFVVFKGNDRRIFRLSKCVEVEAFNSQPRLTHKKKSINPQEINFIVCRCNSRGDVEEWADLKDWRKIEKEIADQKESRSGPSLVSMYQQAVAR